MKIKAPKKLIEVALPLDEINEACIREKSIRHGHPSTLHLYWARRPLAAARAVLFAQMVNDPGGERGYMSGKTKAQAAEEREELFSIIRDLVKWENTNNESVLNARRKRYGRVGGKPVRSIRARLGLIRKSCRHFTILLREEALYLLRLSA